MSFFGSFFFVSGRFAPFYSCSVSLCSLFVSLEAILSLAGVYLHDMLQVKARVAPDTLCPVCPFNNPSMVFAQHEMRLCMT